MKLDWVKLLCGIIGQLKRDVWGESASDLFDFLLQRAGHHVTNRITVPLSEYMETFGFEDKEKAIERLREDCSLLSGVSMSTKGRAPERFRNYSAFWWFVGFGYNSKAFDVELSDCFVHWLNTGEPDKDFVDMAMSRKNVIEITVRCGEFMEFTWSGLEHPLEEMIFNNAQKIERVGCEYTLIFDKRPKSDWRGSNGRRAPIHRIIR